MWQHPFCRWNKQITEVYAPQDWANIIRTARKRSSNPYTVVPLEYSRFLDFKKAAKHFNMNMDDSGHKVNWTKLKAITFIIEHAYYRYSFSAEVQYKTIPLIRKRSSRAISTSQPPFTDLEKRYSEPLTVSERKKSDLLALCKKGLVPKAYRIYFDSL